MLYWIDGSQHADDQHRDSYRDLRLQNPKLNNVALWWCNITASLSQAKGRDKKNRGNYPWM